jgi:hypothetical protein
MVSCLVVVTFLVGSNIRNHARLARNVWEEKKMKGNLLIAVINLVTTAIGLIGMVWLFKHSLLFWLARFIFGW